MPQHLLLNLEGPLLAFGGESVDHVRPVDPFPAASLLTGLLGSALGWRRSADREQLQNLQARLVFAARLDREPAQPRPLADLQTAQLRLTDAAWTTRGQPQDRRAAAKASFSGPHLRRRDYHQDLKMTVALRLEPAREHPDLKALAAALQRPARPLFLGRKNCPPSSSLFQGLAKAKTALAALLACPLAPDPDSAEPDLIRVQYPPSENQADRPGGVEIPLTQLRDWSNGQHSGRLTVVQASLPRSHFAPSDPDTELP